MSECPFCKEISSPIIKENNNAIACIGNYFREGHCTIILKSHKISVSEMSPEEYTDVFSLISEISKALEIIYDCEKTYLLSIGDIVEHFHIHLIPKHKDKCSMGVYCFGKLQEAEGNIAKTESENLELRDKIVELL